MCKLCSHSERYIIENLLLSQKECYSSIKKKYSLGYEVIKNHMENHIIKTTDTNLLSTIENIVIDNINITEAIKNNLLTDLVNNQNQILSVIEQQRKYIDTIAKMAVSLDFIKNKNSSDGVSKILIEFVGDNSNELENK